METLKIKSELLQKLRCPCCMSKLRLSSDSLTCSNQQCGVAFPVVNGVCILINESDSLFSINDIIGQQNNKGKSLRKSQRVLYMQKAKKILPQLGRNLKAEKIYAKFSDILHQQKERPQVLIIGCGREKGEGLQNIQDDSSIYFVDTDITIHDRNCLVCDAHVIPFADQTFDGVIIQAVLEHVVNPFRCVEEIWRVLKKNGIIYSDTPFMQQVHEGRYDFTRFTHLGHRFLFRKFEEIESGSVLGPGCALAWAYNYFLLSFVRSKLSRNFIKIFARLTAFWLKYFDYFLIDKPGGIDAASANYFLGRKTDRIIPDREMIKQYRGAQK